MKNKGRVDFLKKTKLFTLSNQINLIFLKNQAKIFWIKQNR